MNFNKDAILPVTGYHDITVERKPAGFLSFPWRKKLIDGSQKSSWTS